MAVRRGFRSVANAQQTPPAAPPAQELNVAVPRNFRRVLRKKAPPIPEFTVELMRALVDRDDPHILEIGANDGTDTQEFLRMFPGAKITCFECDPRAIAGWKARIGDNPRATLVESALGETVGTLPFHQSGGKPPGKEWANIKSWDKSGSLLKPDRHTDYSKWLTFPGVIKVPVTTLDTWRGEDDSVVDFCWIDVQGAEAMVLRGGQKTVPKIRWFYTECHSRPYYHKQATLDELQSLLPGFVFHLAYRHDNFLLRNTTM